MGKRWVKKRPKRQPKRAVKQNGQLSRKRGDPRNREEFNIRSEGTVQISKGRVRSKGKLACRIHTKCDCMVRSKNRLDAL